VSTIGELTEARQVARSRHKIFSNKFASKDGKNKRLAAVNKITAMIDAPKMF